MFLTTCSLFFSCAESNLEFDDITIDKPNLVSGESFSITLKKTISIEDNIDITLVDNDRNVYEHYPFYLTNNKILVNRFLTSKVNYLKKYFISVKINKINKIIPITINPSILVKSFCATKDCNSFSGNVINEISNSLYVEFFKIKPTKITYEIRTPYENYSYNNEYNSPVNIDWVENIVFKSIPNDLSHYIALIKINAYENESIIAENNLIVKVVRPIEIKHFGKHELAEVYEPIPVTGCIPGTIGSNIQYSESESETRQKSVSININRSWSDSFSSNQTQTVGEGISVGETKGTVISSSMAESVTQSESFSDTSSQGESSDISFNTSDGENWSWALNESNSETQGQSQGQNTNTTVNGTTTIGVSGEGSLPFLAKASGKVEVSAGLSSSWGDTSSNSSSETNTSNRGYSTGGSSESGRTFGSVQSDSRSYSLSGSYVLSNSSSNAISDSSSLSSNRVWNMSESLSSGKVVTEGNGESISQTIVNSSSSSTTFSYSGYIPRGRYGIFFRQTSRYVKLSEIITYNLDGFPQHAGFIMMNSWAWAPELSVSESCENAIISNLPQAECLIPPCGE